MHSKSPRKKQEFAQIYPQIEIEQINQESRQIELIQKAEIHNKNEPQIEISNASAISLNQLDNGSSIDLREPDKK